MSGPPERAGAPARTPPVVPELPTVTAMVCWFAPDEQLKKQRRGVERPFPPCGRSRG